MFKLGSNAVRAAVGAVGVAALAVGAGPAWADVPPPDQIYPRVQAWDCGDLGNFVTLYGSPGHFGTVKWLSRDGGRGDAVQVTVVSSETWLTFGGAEPLHFVTREPAPQRVGQDQFMCSIFGASEDGLDSIRGWALVGVVGGTSGLA